MSSFYKLIVSLTIIFIVLISCSTHKSTTITSKKTAAEFNQNLISSDTSLLQIIDVRTPAEYATGYINNAINIDFYNPNFEAEIKKLDKTKPVYIYCKAGGRSSEAVNIFMKNGFKNVYELKGGIMSWEQAGLPIASKQDTSPKSNTVVPEIAISEKRENLSVEEFQNLVAATPVTIVDFTAVWCGPCRMLSPVLDELERKYGHKIKVIKIDVDKNKTVSNYYVVSLIPFLQFYKNGRIQEQIEGLPTRENLIYQINKLLK